MEKKTERKLSIIERLSAIQKKLNVPKNLKAHHFNYRNVETILSEVKKLLKDDEVLLLKDDIEMKCERVYIKATVTLRKGKEEIKTTAYAREAITKTGMDDAQITGSTSSYARKYALNGLFAIDDNKDIDSMDNNEVEKELQESKPAKPSLPIAYESTPCKECNEMTVTKTFKGVDYFVCPNRKKGDEKHDLFLKQ